jgi:hypothetical protein
MYALSRLVFGDLSLHESLLWVLSESDSDRGWAFLRVQKRSQRSSQGFLRAVFGE